MSITSASVTDAQQAQARGARYVDVRSTAEYDAGHPVGAVNVPLLEPDEDTGQLMPNPDFIRVMQANFAPDAPLLVGCKTGGRSARAAQMLEAFGYTHVTNVAGGFVDWTNRGLPVDTTAPDGDRYGDLLDRANQHP